MPISFNAKTRVTNMYFLNGTNMELGELFHLHALKSSAQHTHHPLLLPVVMMLKWSERAEEANLKAHELVNVNRDLAKEARDARAARRGNASRSPSEQEAQRKSEEDRHNNIAVAEYEIANADMGFVDSMSTAIEASLQEVVGLSKRQGWQQLLARARTRDEIFLLFEQVRAYRDVQSSHRQLIRQKIDYQQQVVSGFASLRPACDVTDEDTLCSSTLRSRIAMLRPISGSRKRQKETARPCRP